MVTRLLPDSPIIPPFRTACQPVAQGTGSYLIGDGHLIDPVSLHQPDSDILITRTGHILAHVVGPYRQLTVPTVNEHYQVYRPGATEVNQGIHGGTNAATGVEYVINQHHCLTFDTNRDVGVLHYGLLIKIGQVIAIETDIEGANR
jgi:hypothetical protein